MNSLLDVLTTKGGTHVAGMVGGYSTDR